MKKSLCFAMIAAALVSGCDVENDYFRTSRSTQVHQLADGVFEVVPLDMGRLPEFWCGAGEYARRGLGAGWQDRVYVHRGLGPGPASGRRSVVLFTMTAPDNPPPSQTIERINAFKPGQSLTVRSAESQCSFRRF